MAITKDLNGVVRWGIIGCGDVCEVKSGPVFQKASGSKLVAVMRRDAAKAEDYARRHGVPRWYDDATKLINDPEVDAVYVATPPGSHLEHALAVAAAGKPCYVEKPMARSYAECRRMVDAFAAKQLPLFVAYYRRRLPRFLRVEQLLKDGAIGTVTSVNYRMSRPFDPHPSGKWRLDAGLAGGGLFLDVGSHTLDILDYWFGPLADVRGSASRFGPDAVEDCVSMSFRTRDGAVGVGLWNYAGHKHEDSIEITGTRGRICLSTFGTEAVALDTRDGRQMFDEPTPPHVQQPLVQTIVDELLGRGRCPSTGEGGARTSAVMDAVLHDFYRGRDDAFWKREATWEKKWPTKLGE
jgi:predicted dehydrogenase